MHKLNVLVTGIGGGSHGEQIIKSLKLANDINIKIVGTDANDLTIGKKIVDKFYQVPFVSDERYEDIIFDIIKKNNIQFIFHGSEPDLKFISNNRKKFEDIGVKHCLNSSQVIGLCMNKYETYKKLYKLGIKLPKFKKINALKDVDGINFYPLVLKPNVNSGGSSNVFIILDKFECKLFVKYMLKHNIDIIAQEYVGNHTNEYTIGVASDQSTNILGSIAINRILTSALSIRSKISHDDNVYVVSSGISQGKVVYKKNLQKQAEKIAKLIKSEGPLNIQCREVNGELLLFEINPRLSGSTSLRTIAGYNEPVKFIKYKVFNQKWKKTYNEMSILRTLQEVKID